MSDRRPPVEESGEEIDAGAVENIRELSFRADQHRAQTSRWLAFVIVLFLAVSVAIHYGAVIYLATHGHESTVPLLDRIFQVWLPVISGLASAAVTYYFTRQREQ